MKVGDLILYYHSNCKPPHVAGVARVIKQGYPDHTSWDPDSKYFDPKSTPESPRWFMVDIEPVVATYQCLWIQCAKILLRGNASLARGQRLSVQPVDDVYFNEICAMGGLNPDEI